MGTTAEKLKYLNETKAEIKNALETPYNVMRDYPELIKKYIDNQPTKVVTDGICGNAVDVPVKAIEINGNIRQETTEGYNLLNVPAEYTILSTEVFKKVPISLKANHTYTIKIGQINTDNTDVTSVLFRFMYNEVDISDTYAYAKLSDLKTVYTLASDVDAVLIYSGDSYAQGAKTNTTYKNLMIYEGTEDKSYEPYTGGAPSPSPDYPQEITNVGENGIKIKQSGKNLLNVPANFTVTNTDIHNDIAISLKANITYTIKAKTISSDNKDVKNCLFRFRYNNADVSNPNARIPISGLKTTYTPPADIDEVWIYSGTGHNESALSNTTFEDLMIYEGIEDASYEPYHEPIITPINLQGNVLSKVGNVKDILKVNRNGKVEIKKNIGKVVLDGTENWIYDSMGENTGTTICYKIEIDDYVGYDGGFAPIGKLICTHFKEQSIYQNELEGVQGGWGKNIFLKLEQSNLSVAGIYGFKAWLAAQKEAGTPVIVYYELATPQIITLPSISPIELWQGTNIFSLVTNLETEIELEYIVDKDSVLNEVQTAMLEAEI